MRVSTGIKGLDKLLGGGIPERSTVLLIGPPGAGKSTIALNFAYSCLKNDLPCIYLSTCETPSTLRKKMKLFNPDAEKHFKNLVFIDACSCKSGLDPEGVGVRSLSDMTHVNIALKTTLEETKFKDGAFVLDSVSDLLMYSNEQSVVKLIQIIRSKLKALDSVGLIVAEEGLHSAREVAALNFATDGTIRVDVVQNKRALRIERMTDTHHTLDWVDYEITGDSRINVREFFK